MTGVVLEQLPTILAEQRRVLQIAAAIPRMTPQQLAAFEFLSRWLDVSRRYGRHTYRDVRVQAARREYRSACASNQWSKAA